MHIYFLQSLENMDIPIPRFQNMVTSYPFVIMHYFEKDMYLWNLGILAGFHDTEFLETRVNVICGHKRSHGLKWSQGHQHI